MKKTITILLAVVLAAFTACENIKEKLEITIPFKGQEITFNVNEATPPLKIAAPMYKVADENEIELMNETLTLDLNKAAKDRNYNLERLVGLKLTDAKLELVEPEGYDMNVFDKLKLYINGNLVAEAVGVEEESVLISITEPDLLDNLAKEDKELSLNIILTGKTRPTGQVTLKLITSYNAIVKAFKF